MASLLSYGFLAPPTIFILFCLLGPLIALVWRRTGLAIALVSGICLFAAATPALSSYLLRQVEAEIPDEDQNLESAQAIVVIGVDIRVAKTGDADELGPATLQRLIYAIGAYHQLHKSVAVTGGRVRRAHKTIAALMKETLETDFGVPVTWTEGESRTTWENADFTARLLLPAGIKTVIVVADAPDLPRALWSFRAAGLQPLAWPVPRTPRSWDEFLDFMPSLNGLQQSFHALHEMLGNVDYHLCYGPAHEIDEKPDLIISIMRQLLDCDTYRRSHPGE